MINVNPCEKCGYRHGRGNCCIDVYQRLGQKKGPSVAGKVLLAFALPVLVFIGTLIVAEYLLSVLMNEGGLKTFIAFLAALSATLVCVRLIRIITRKPVNVESKRDKVM